MATVKQLAQTPRSSAAEVKEPAQAAVQAVVHQLQQQSRQLGSMPADQMAASEYEHAKVVTKIGQLRQQQAKNAPRAGDENTSLMQLRIENKPIVPFTEKETRAAVARIQGLTVVESVRLPKDMYSAHGKGAQKGAVLISKRMTFQTVKANRGAWYAMQNNPIAVKADAQGRRGHHRPDVYQYLLTASLYQASGGTPQGLYATLEEGLNRPQVKVQPSEAEMLKLRFVLPHDFTHETKLDGETPFVNLVNELDIIQDSYAGQPFIGSNQENLSAMVDVALEYQQVVYMEGIKGAIRWEAKNPHHALYTLFNKMDCYLKSDVKKKTRPIYAPPGGLKLCFMVIAQNAQHTLQTFEQNPDSISAYKFSWSDGGATRLVKHMHDPKFGVPKCVVYGDDQVWSVRLKDGSVYVVNPDCSKMDMSLNVSHTTVAWKNHCSQNASMSPAYVNLAALAYTHCVQHLMLVDYSVVVKKNKGLSSGAPATTYVDMVAAAVAWVRDVQPALAAVETLDQLKNTLAAIGERVTQHSGLYLKKGTYEEPLLVDERTGKSPIKFLGMTPVRCTLAGAEDQWIPVPADLPRLFARWVHPKSYPNKLDSLKYLTLPTLMYDRCVGIATSGGWSDPLFYDALAMQAGAMVAAGAHQIQEAYVSDVLRGQEDDPYQMPWSASFKSAEELQTLYVPTATSMQLKEAWATPRPRTAQEMREAQIVRELATYEAFGTLAVPTPAEPPLAQLRADRPAASMAASEVKEQHPLQPRPPTALPPVRTRPPTVKLRPEALYDLRQESAEAIAGMVQAAPAQSNQFAGIAADARPVSSALPARVPPDHDRRKAKAERWALLSATRQHFRVHVRMSKRSRDERIKLARDVAILTKHGVYNDTTDEDYRTGGDDPENEYDAFDAHLADQTDQELDRRIDEYDNRYMVLQAAIDDRFDDAYDESLRQDADDDERERRDAKLAATVADVPYGD